MPEIVTPKYDPHTKIYFPLITKWVKSMIKKGIINSSAQIRHLIYIKTTQVRDLNSLHTNTTYNFSCVKICGNAVHIPLHAHIMSQKCVMYTH